MQWRLTEFARTRVASSSRLLTWLTLLIAMLASTARTGATAELAEDLRPFLVTAIDAPDGRAAGILAGPLAETLRNRGISDAPLRVEVTTLRTYREAGCRRLNVRFQQSDVKLGEGPPIDRAAAFQLNYCRDGRPPRRLE